MEQKNRGRKRKTELQKERRQNYDEDEKIEKKELANELQKKDDSTIPKQKKSK